jgi:uncharacterized protein YdeI (YjbR/CyaY-like superfamily)
MRHSPKPVFFRTPAEFRRWLRANHAKASELWVGYYKKGTELPSITWPESVDEALCYGWIDGIRKSLDEISYATRFTPRRAGSVWSAINIAKMKRLTAAKRVRPAGLHVYEVRDPKKVQRYSFEQLTAAAKLSQKEIAKFKKNAKAWRFFAVQPPGYRRTAMWYVVSGKRESTRALRLKRLIADSAAGLRIGLLRRPDKTC